MKSQIVIKFYSVVCVIWLTIIKFSFQAEGGIAITKISDLIFISFSILSVIFIISSKSNFSKSSFNKVISIIISIAILTSLLIWIPDNRFGTSYSETLKTTSLLITVGLSLFSFVSWILVRYSE